MCCLMTFLSSDFYVTSIKQGIYLNESPPKQQQQNSIEFPAFSQKFFQLGWLRKECTSGDKLCAYHKNLILQNPLPN